ncbi:hypothetical protein OAT16_05595 [Prolixibacteraceae bacterium]|nr:hypothetical protein [Prolixibacteraceae bacterium]
MDKKQYNSFAHTLKLLFSGNRSHITSIGSQLNQQTTKRYMLIMVGSYGGVILLKYLFNLLVAPTISSNDLYSIVTAPLILFLTPWLTAMLLTKMINLTDHKVTQKELFQCLIVATIPVWVIKLITTAVPWLYLLWILTPYMGYILYYLYQSKEHFATTDTIRYTIGTVLLYLCVHISTSFLFSWMNRLLL